MSSSKSANVVRKPNNPVTKKPNSVVGASAPGQSHPRSASTPSQAVSSGSGVNNGKAPADNKNGPKPMTDEEKKEAEKKRKEEEKRLAEEKAKREAEQKAAKERLEKLLQGLMSKYLRSGKVKIKVNAKQMRLNTHARFKCLYANCDEELPDEVEFDTKWTTHIKTAEELIDYAEIQLLFLLQRHFARHCAHQADKEKRGKKTIIPSKKFDDRDNEIRQERVEKSRKLNSEMNRKDKERIGFPCENCLDLSVNFGDLEVKKERKRDRFMKELLR